MSSRILTIAVITTLASGGEVVAQGIGVGGSFDVEPITPTVIGAEAPVPSSAHPRLGSSRYTPITRKYSAKFLCGQLPGEIRIGKPPVPRDMLTPGDYLTTISVHNPNDFPVELIKKAVVTNPERESRGKIGGPVTETLGPDEGIEIDCLDVLAVLELGPFQLTQLSRGFVVITSRFDVDVVGAYSYKSVTASCSDPDGVVFPCDVSSFQFVR